MVQDQCVCSGVKTRRKGSAGLERWGPKNRWDPRAFQETLSGEPMRF